MAYDISVSGNYSSRPGFYLLLYVRRDQTDYANNRSSYCWELRCVRNGGSNETWNGNARTWNVHVMGYNWSGAAALDMRGKAFLTLATGCTGWVAHDSEGFLNGYVGANHGDFGTGSFGSASCGGTLSADRIAKAPAQNAAPTVTNINPTSAQINWTNPPDWRGGTPWGFSLQWATDPNFTQNVQYWDVGASSPKTLTSLNPGTAYRVRVRSRNSSTYDNDGWGPWSNSTFFTTTASVAPGLVVVPQPSGTRGTATFSPPNGGSGVVSYTLQRRVLGSTATTSTNYTTVTAALTGLVPGTTYEWRVAANYSSSSSPWSAWQAVTQPQPNTNAGDFFDGATPDTPDNDYSWTGTANGSTSQALGKRPLGWTAFADSGTAVVQRVTGGRTGSYSARLIVTADSVDVRMSMSNSSTGRSEVEANANYWGSAYVLSPVNREYSAHISWINAAGIKIGESNGSVVLIPANEWTRVTCTGAAPPDAEFGLVQVGGGNLIAGETFQVDNMMLSLSTLLPYFDGSTADTTEYDYSWTGDADESISQRVTRPAETVNPLIDPDCAVVPAPPRPPAVPDTCIIETGQWRRYWGYIPQSEVSDWLTMVPTITLNTGPYPARQVRIRIYPNPNNRAPNELSPEAYCSEQIISYMPENTVMVLDGVSQSAWATVGDLDPMSADHLLYGTGGVPPVWPELSCGMAHVIAFDVPLDAPEGSLSPTIDLTTRTG